MAVLVLGAAGCLAQSGDLSGWTKLVDKNECEKAKSLCTGFAASKDAEQQAEAQRCLGNVSLCGHSMMIVQGDKDGNGTQRGSYQPVAIDEALKHFNAGIKLAPQSIKLHQDRLRILGLGARYDQMIKALDESCTVYHGRDVPGAWMGFSSGLADLGQFDKGLEFTKVLDKHYPDSPEVLGNIGGFLFWLKRPAEAIPYLQRATALDPKDESNAWDLARAYDATDKVALAEKWYQTGLSLQTDPLVAKESKCLYAMFVDAKLKDRTRACTLEKENCDDARQKACAPPPKAQKPAAK